MRKFPSTLERMFQIKTEKLPLFRTNNDEIHSYAKPYTTKNNRLKSHQFQVHVSHKNTICADISS